MTVVQPLYLEVTHTLKWVLARTAKYFRSNPSMSASYLDLLRGPITHCTGMAAREKWRELRSHAASRQAGTAIANAVGPKFIRFLVDKVEWHEMPSDFTAEASRRTARCTGSKWNAAVPCPDLCVPTSGLKILYKCAALVSPFLYEHSRLAAGCPSHSRLTQH